jgi:hypothetical protein
LSYAAYEAAIEASCRNPDPECPLSKEVKRVSSMLDKLATCMAGARKRFIPDNLDGELH